MNSNINSWKGRSSDRPTAARTDFFVLSVGATQRSSLVFFRSICAFFFRIMGSVVEVSKCRTLVILSHSDSESLQRTRSETYGMSQGIETR